MSTRTTRTTALGQNSPTDCPEHSDNGALIGPVSVRVVGNLETISTRTKSKRVRVVDWPPREYSLPDDLDQIEAGGQLQRTLFDEVPDDSRESRLARLSKGHRHG